MRTEKNTMKIERHSPSQVIATPEALNRIADVLGNTSENCGAAWEGKIIRANMGNGDGAITFVIEITNRDGRKIWQPLDIESAEKLRGALGQFISIIQQLDEANYPEGQKH